jgi:tRNA/rRNA methyltransferase
VHDAPAISPDSRVVLVSPKEPGNIGAAARAMKNMGLSRLALVAPRCDVGLAYTLASHARDVIDGATLHDTLYDAVAGHSSVVGTTARPRKGHLLAGTPREVAPRLPQHGNAVVFGREESGLSNEELDLCTAYITIPTAGEYASLNLAQAVLIVVYELLLARSAPREAPANPLPARAAMEALHQHWLDFMLESGFTDEQRSEHASRTWRRIIERSQPDEKETAFLRGLASQGIWATRHRKS